MKDPHMHPAYVYALDKLGYIVTVDNAARFTDDELQAWDDAVQEWCDLHPDEPGP
jgi:hypothetical protein